MQSRDVIANLALKNRLFKEGVFEMILQVTTPHGYSRGLLSSTGLPPETVPEGHALACTRMFLAALTSRSAI